MGEYHAEMGAYLLRYFIGRWSIWVHGDFSGSRAHCAHPVFCLLRLSQKIQTRFDWDIMMRLILRLAQLWRAANFGRGIRPCVIEGAKARALAGDVYAPEDARLMVVGKTGGRILPSSTKGVPQDADSSVAKAGSFWPSSPKSRAV